MSPDDYYREGQGSLMQCVLTPADPYLPLPNEEIARRVDAQVRDSIRTMSSSLDSSIYERACCLHEQEHVGFHGYQNSAAGWGEQSCIASIALRDSAQRLVRYRM